MSDLPSLKDIDLGQSDAAAQIVALGQNYYSTEESNNHGSGTTKLDKFVDSLNALETKMGQATPAADPNAVIALIAAQKALRGYDNGLDIFREHEIDEINIYRAQKDYANTYDHRTPPAIAQSILTSLGVTQFDPKLQNAALLKLEAIDLTRLKVLDQRLKSSDLPDATTIDGKAAAYASGATSAGLHLKENDLSNFESALSILGSQKVNPDDASGSFIVKGLLTTVSVGGRTSSGTVPALNEISGHVRQISGNVHWDANAPMLTIPAAEPNGTATAPVPKPDNQAANTQTVNTSGPQQPNATGYYDLGASHMSADSEKRVRDYLDKTFKAIRGNRTGGLTELKVDFGASADAPGSATANQRISDARMHEMETLAADVAAKDGIKLTVGKEDSIGSKGAKPGAEPIRRNATISFTVPH